MTHVLARDLLTQKKARDLFFFYVVNELREVCIDDQVLERADVFYNDYLVVVETRDRSFGAYHE